MRRDFINWWESPLLANTVSPLDRLWSQWVSFTRRNGNKMRGNRGGPGQWQVWVSSGLTPAWVQVHQKPTPKWRCICRLFLGSLFRDSNWKKVQVAGLSRGKVGLRCWDYRSSTAPGLGWPFKAVSNYIPPGTCHCIQVAPARGWKDYLGQSHSLHPSAMPRKGLSCEPPAASDPSSWGKEMGAQACRGDLGSKPLHLFLTTNWEKTMSEGFSKKPRQEYYRCFDHRMNIPGI